MSSATRKYAWSYRKEGEQHHRLTYITTDQLDTPSNDCCTNILVVCQSPSFEDFRSVDNGHATVKFTPRDIVLEVL
jgi:hypothetical protein